MRKTKRGKSREQTEDPQLILGIERITHTKILGVHVDNRLCTDTHVDMLITNSAQSLHALRLLRSHGLHTSLIYSIFKSTVLSRITYCSSAWRSFTTASSMNKLEAYLRKAIKLNYAPPSINTIDHIFNKIDNTYFKRVITDPTHLLHPLLPPQKAQQRYTLRKRPHNFCLPIKHDTLFSANFIIRMLYAKNS